MVTNFIKFSPIKFFPNKKLPTLISLKNGTTSPITKEFKN